MAVELPEMVYLNHGDSYNFTCLLTLANSGDYYQLIFYLMQFYHLICKVDSNLVWQMLQQMHYYNL